MVGGADYCVFRSVAALKSVCLANKLNIIHGRKRLDVGYILYVLQALGYPLKLAGENARIWDHPFLWMVRVVDFFQLFFSSRVVGGLGWCFPDSGVGRVFLPKARLAPLSLEGTSCYSALSYGF